MAIKFLGCKRQTSAVYNLKHQSPQIGREQAAVLILFNYIGGNCYNLLILLRIGEILRFCPNYLLEIFPGIFVPVNV